MLTDKEKEKIKEIKEDVKYADKSVPKEHARYLLKLIKKLTK